MTYERGRNLPACSTVTALASHPAEWVRGDLLWMKAPSSGPSDHLLPKGRRAICGCAGEILKQLSAGLGP